MTPRLPRLRTAAAGSALLLVFVAPGCAHRNGNTAEFCAKVPQTPAVSLLVGTVQGGSIATTVARINSLATSMRSLERVAPRTIRTDVAITADFAEHLADELSHVPDTPATTSTTVAAVPGSVPTSVLPGYPSNPYQPGTYNPYVDPRVQAVDRVFSRYPRALRATSSFVGYAKKHCGADVVPQGYQSTGDSGDGGLGGFGGLDNSVPTPTTGAPPVTNVAPTTTEHVRGATAAGFCTVYRAGLRTPTAAARQAFRRAFVRLDAAAKARHESIASFCTRVLADWKAAHPGSPPTTQPPPTGAPANGKP